MKKQTILLIISILFISCGSVKETQEAINYGDYNKAINNAIKQLRNNKTKKSNQPYILMLEDAFSKASVRDLEKIAFLKKDGNNANLETIYMLYINLDNRQKSIKPLLPLPILEKGRNAQFNFIDYTNAIVKTKKELSHYLYTNAKNMLHSSNTKIDFRNAYADLQYVENINPNFKDTRALMKQAYYKGTDYVLVSIQNKTEMAIPKRLEEDLLNFNTYKLDDFWTVFHSSKQPKLSYDFEIELNLREINISPEQIHEKEVIYENGNVVVDTLGNKIKVDVFKTIRCKLYKVTQFKAVQVVGQVKYINLKTKQLIKAHPLASEFIFEHRFATYRGDKNALDKASLRLVQLNSIPFPSNDQMIYDSGEDLKRKIKRIITRNRFR